MEQKNKYGFVSGGYIFDWLDRGALAFINKRFPETTNQNWYTARADISYLKQLCDPKNALTMYTIASKLEDEITCNTEVYQEAKTIVRATFVFRLARHNYCDIKGGKDE